MEVVAHEDRGMDRRSECTTWSGHGGSGDFSKRDCECADTLATSFVVPLCGVTGWNERRADGDNLGGDRLEWLRSLATTSSRDGERDTVNRKLAIIEALSRPDFGCDVGQCRQR